MIARSIGARCVCMVVFMCAATVQAAPVIYTGFVVTDVSLGGAYFHNAQITIKFFGDTRDIRSFSVTAPDGGAGSGLLIDRGRSTVQIRSGSVLLNATFAPKQILVALDSYNGGVGFSSYIGPTGLEPAYPLAFVDGTAPTTNLSAAANVSGNAWSCIGYPPNRNSGDCIPPDGFPLKTDHGDFFIYQPYTSYFTDGTLGSFGASMNRGFFSITPGSSDD